MIPTTEMFSFFPLLCTNCRIYVVKPADMITWVKGWLIEMHVSIVLFFIAAKSNFTDFSITEIQHTFENILCAKGKIYIWGCKPTHFHKVWLNPELWLYHSNILHLECASYWSSQEFSHWNTTVSLQIQSFGIWTQSVLPL